MMYRIMEGEFEIETVSPPPCWFEFIQICRSTTIQRQNYTSAESSTIKVLELQIHRKYSLLSCLYECSECPLSRVG